MDPSNANMQTAAMQTGPSCATLQYTSGPTVWRRSTAKELSNTSVSQDIRGGAQCEHGELSVQDSADLHYASICQPQAYLACPPCSFDVAAAFIVCL